MHKDSSFSPLVASQIRIRTFLNVNVMIKKIKLLFLLCFTIALQTSCTTDDDHLEVPVEQSTDGEADDPAKPDEDDFQ